MKPASLAVIKLGGSLFDWPELPRRWSEFAAAARILDRDERMLVIAGGGAAADIVRMLDQIHGLGDLTAHRLALHAMDFSSAMLSAILPGTIAVDHPDRLFDAWSQEAIPILAPRRVLDELEIAGKIALPASWDVTSDSIAAALAAYLGAHRLILLKSAPVPAGADLGEAVRLGLVDPMFPVAARELSRVEYVNLREQSPRPQHLT